MTGLHRRPRLGMLVAGALGLALGSAGVTVATVESDADIHACRDMKDGALRVVDEPGTCEDKRETALTWAVAGPPGEPGPVGPQGPPGPSGPALSSLEQLAGVPCREGTPHEGTVEIRYDAAGVATLDCHFPTHRLTVRLTNVDKFTFRAIDVNSVLVNGAPFCTSGEEFTTTCVEDIRVGTQLEVTAAPHADDYFALWSGDCAGTSREQPCILTLDRDLVIGAEFWDGAP